ncbi:MAG: hypothetical protein Q8Q39_03160 [bacterium]|nr:hypothetical protein [bacterium]
MLSSLVSLVIYAVFGASTALAEPLPAPSPLVEQDIPIGQVEEVANVRTITMTLTAYSSSPDETDSTPFITAMGTRTRDGVVATNDLPFNTRVRIPAYFGDKEFVVEDRMNRRYTGRQYLDLWMPSKSQALRFGFVEGVEVEILQ